MSRSIHAPPVDDSICFGALCTRGEKQGVFQDIFYLKTFACLFLCKKKYEQILRQGILDIVINESFGFSFIPICQNTVVQERCRFFIIGNQGSTGKDLEDKESKSPQIGRRTGVVKRIWRLR